MRTRAGVVAVVIATMALAGCGGDDAPALPEATNAPESNVTEAPVTEAPATEPPATEAPTTEPAATEPPVTEPPVTEPPITEPPVTEPPATEPPTTVASTAFQIDATVVGGQPDGGIRSYIVAVGTTVEITVVSDTADEGHLHGYDIEVDLEPGVPATLTFTADMTGSFEFELHESGALLFYLDVA